MKRHPIVILHGWNLSAERFSPLCDVLRKRGYTVVCENLPGFGDAPAPQKPWVLNDYVTHVTSMLARQHLVHPILIGHSFGGRIAIKLATKYPTLLPGLVLSGTPGYNPVSSTIVRISRLIAKLGGTITSLPGLSLAQSHLRLLLYRLLRGSDYYKTTPAMRETFKRIVGEPLDSLLPHVSVPTLLLWGEEDRIVPVSIAYRMAKAMPRAQVVTVPKARHGIPWTHPEQFADELERFLKTL